MKSNSKLSTGVRHRCLAPVPGTMFPSVIQSPMASHTDLPFRIIAREHGMRFAFLEMISSNALVYNSLRTREIAQTLAEDRPLGVQLVGCSPGILAEAAARVEDWGVDVLDLNLGCPVPKIVGKHAGSALMKQPELAREIFQKVVRAVRRLPVTVKMRKGFEDPSGEEAVLLARIAEDCGLAAVTVHGRTRAQGYSGMADYQAIAKVKRAVRIPVIGNGDVFDGPSAVRLVRETGCDGVMLGRGAIGNPWIYREVEAALSGEAAPEPPTWAERRRVMLRHMDLQIQYEKHGPEGPLRKILGGYIKTMPGAAELRARFHKARTVGEMRQILLSFPPGLREKTLPEPALVCDNA